MHIIPVIDLMNGIVVHAKQGRREQYRPLRSALSPTPAPEAVIEGLLHLHRFQTLYLADLDALTGQAPQTELIARLTRTFSGLRFWVDRGWPESGDNPIEGREYSADIVIGSESLNVERLDMLAAGGQRFILSLDFLNGRLLGPGELLRRTEYWPQDIILMSLAHVGSGEGPDLARAMEFRQRFPERRFVTAGGVRGEADLEALKAMGMAAVLLASALHSGAIDGRVLERFR